MKKLVKLFPEFVALPIIIVFWWAVTRTLPYIFPQAGVIDEGIIQVPILATLFLLAANFVVYAGIKYNEPFLWSWYKENFEKSSPYSPWLFLAMYAVRLVVFALFALAIA
jgi:hypothetical protein